MGDNKSNKITKQKIERFHKKQIKHDPQAESARTKFGKKDTDNPE